jgi:hypothetical protein
MHCAVLRRYSTAQAAAEKGIEKTDRQELSREEEKDNGAPTLPRRRRRLPGPQFFFSPAPKIETLLRSCGVDIPQYIPGKTNLRYISPFVPVRHRQTDAKPRRKEQAASKRLVKYSLREITALFVHHCQVAGCFDNMFSDSGDARQKEREARVVREVFQPPARKYLEQKGCSSEDVMGWAWILLAKNGRIAGHRLQAYVKHNPILPPFLILQVLRRKHIRRAALRSMFPVIENFFKLENPLGIIDYKTTVLLAIRLLRQLRETWPEALPRVVDLIVNNFYGDNPPGERLPEWVTHTYNRLLFLFSFPTSDRPFENVPLLQKCQFAIVQRMASLNAPITREGYRGIISVQMAHTKLVHEAEKVRNMGRNWPPYQVERDGWIAAHRRTYEGMRSRGGTVIQQMIEAGYGMMDWEREALVLTGTDTDSSPTIQTRTFWNMGRHSQYDSSKDSPGIWVARVRATRTLEEAWFNFQECQRTVGTPSRIVWEQMFEKLIWAKRLQKHLRYEELTRSGPVLDQLNRREIWLRRLAEQRTRVVPGDGKELVPAPTNPSEGVFNAEEPPYVDELFTEMVRSGIKPSHRLASMLVSETYSSSFALTVLKHWDAEQATQIIGPLYSFSSPFTSSHSKRERGSVNKNVLTAFLSQLCNARNTDKAVRLLRHHRPAYRPAWNIVIASVVNSLSPLGSPNRHSFVLSENVRAVWKLYKEMTDLVDIDTETLRLLAVTAERWVTIGLGSLALWDGAPPVERIVPIFFQELEVAADPSHPDRIPMISPQPAALHAFVRALGLARSYPEIETLVRFLGREGARMEEPIEKRVLVACKVFLEGAGFSSYGVDKEVMREEGWEAMERLDPLVRAKWGGWGAVGKEQEEQMVEEYLVMAGLKRGRRVEVVEEGVNE